MVKVADSPTQMVSLLIELEILEPVITVTLTVLLFPLSQPEELVQVAV
jgi:hypothetical protein